VVKSTARISVAWLARYVAQDEAPPRYEELMERLAYARAGRSFSRDELNGR